MVVPKEINVHSVTTRFKMKPWSMSWHVPVSWDGSWSKTPFCYRWSPPRIQSRCTTSCKQLLAGIPMHGHSFSPTWTCHTSRPTTMWVWSFPCSMKYALREMEACGARGTVKVADFSLTKANNIFKSIGMSTHKWVWVKIRYPNNWMVNTKLD